MELALKEREDRRNWKKVSQDLDLSSEEENVDDEENPLASRSFLYFFILHGRREKVIRLWLFLQALVISRIKDRFVKNGL